MRLAAAAGRDVGYPLLRALRRCPEPDVRESLRRAVEHGVLVAEQATGSFRFRHALLAEAIYATILPGEREELHARLADELARSGAASPAELAPHWAAAGRSPEALAASVDAARQAEAVFGLAEAHAHLERALALWHAVPDAAELAGLDLAGLCSWAAELASRRARPRARSSSHGERSSSSAPTTRTVRRSCMSGSVNTCTRPAVTTPPRRVRARGRARAGGAALAGARVCAGVARGRVDGGLAPSRSRCRSRAGARARPAVGAREAEVRALTVLGGDLAYLGRGEEGLAHLRGALQLAEEIGDRLGLERAYVNFTDALTMLGRLRESARLGRAGLERCAATGSTAPCSSRTGSRLCSRSATGTRPTRLSAAALRGITSSFPSGLLIFRADVEIGRGEFDAAGAHLDAASATLREDRVLGLYDAHLAELALWQRRWTDADAAVDEAWPGGRREAAQIRV